MDFTTLFSYWRSWPSECSIYEAPIVLVPFNTWPPIWCLRSESNQQTSGFSDQRSDHTYELLRHMEQYTRVELVTNPWQGLVLPLN